MSEIIDVRKIREAKGLTQKELADMCGVTTRTVQNWENGSTMPDMVQKYLTQLTEQGENLFKSKFVITRSSSIGLCPLLNA